MSEDEGTDVTSISPEFPKNWRKGNPVGHGGSVYEIIDDSEPNEVKFVGKDVSVATARTDKEKNIRELKILERIRHQRIVAFHGYQQKPDVLTIFFKYIKLGSVAKLIADRGSPLDEATVRLYTRQILEGLNYLHNNEPTIIHRNVKGENVLLESPGNVQLTNFGLSKILHSQTKARSNVGTSYWMAPEIIQGAGLSSYDVRADIWSVGCTVVEMTTGHPPFHHLNPNQAAFKIGSGERPDYRLPDGTSRQMVKFLERTFKRNYKDRPSAEDLLKSDPFVAAGKL
ncbi:mitogen-activated protein kinase kinase kinase 3-like [Physella acuta]|uniref:mitogen-activated protein kinase kinase kinase 3-like n=1 Tax=Physella acuta TaxID=109671 RepID=UPI0027DCD7A2|nr:mitogen-activated protein kinase kinase kinase 3-like [Physella acuta]XP_059166487.1 mitogen-activated protein kinase kinase kinase 3-like [Physella acuta]